MDAMTLTIIGTIASLIGAGISIGMARAAKTAAQDAKDARADIIAHRKTSEATELKIACKKAQTSMEKYGPGSSLERLTESLKGTTPNGDGKEVQSFMLLVKENRLIFGSKTPNAADEFVESINKILDKFSQSYESPEKTKEYGTELLMAISAMSSVIKKLFDAKKETKKR
jgi:hypothetical protein